MEHHFKSSKIAIWGLGLMGGSLAMALKGQCAAIYAVDRDAATLSLALEKKIVERASSDPAEILPLADVIILAAPVRTIIRLLADLPALHPGPALVLDLGSTKRAVLAAMQALPLCFDPLGGHPMCGKEHGSLVNAEAGLFRGASFAFTPLERTTPQARAWANELAETVAARPLWLPAETHDRWAAAVSHIPYLASNLLAAITPPEAAPLIGSGFRSAARLAPTPAEMMLDILATNRANVLGGLHEYQARLGQLIDLLEKGDEAHLRDFLLQGARAYQKTLPANPVEKK